MYLSSYLWPKTPDSGIFIMAVLVGAILGAFGRTHLENERKQSSEYGSLEKQREEELKAVRVRIVSCPKCGKKLQFERSKLLLSNSGLAWNCPSCKTAISPPQSGVPERPSPAASTIPLDRKVGGVAPSTGSGWGWVIVVGIALWILLSNLGSKRDDPRLPNGTANPPSGQAVAPIATTPPSTLASPAVSPYNEKSKYATIASHRKQNKGDSRHCLSLGSNEAIAQCVERN
jgi:ribosomal protein L37AE/L43A